MPISASVVIDYNTLILEPDEDLEHDKLYNPTFTVSIAN